MVCVLLSPLSGWFSLTFVKERGKSTSNISISEEKIKGFVVLFKNDVS